MKILVIDDNSTNRAAAQAQLLGHELTVVGSYDEAQRLLGVENAYLKEGTYRHDFEAVLVDLLLPASGQMAGSKGTKMVGQEMPVGIFLALLAAKNGAQYVALFTDSDHHSHPASACFDALNPEGETRPSPFTVEGAKMLLCNNRNWVTNFQPDNLAVEMEFEDWHIKKLPSVRAKNWRELLEYIVG
jgi:CheY-like chemotaxis protein